MKWKDYSDKKLQNAEFKKAYDELETEYAIMREMLSLQKKKNEKKFQQKTIEFEKQELD